MRVLRKEDSAASAHRLIDRIERMRMILNKVLLETVGLVQMPLARGHVGKRGSRSLQKNSAHVDCPQRSVHLIVYLGGGRKSPKKHLKKNN